jgi:hypothetical protein
MRRMLSIFGYIAFLSAFVCAVLAPWISPGALSPGQCLGLNALVLLVFAGISALVTSDL